MAGSQMQLEDWLDDLCVRFLINLPQEDLSSVARICFQVEEAQWFYEDFIRPLDPSLPSMSLRTFSLRIFQHCPLLASFSVENHTRAFEEFLEYKTRIPVRGAIMLNEAMDSTVLVKGWKKGANWSFPRGKINKDEDDLDCAIREVYEETGLDLRAAGLVPSDGKTKYIEISMREQHMRLYVFKNVPMDTPFEPKTRKEISKIEWYKLSELPAFRKKGAQNNDSSAVPNANKFYMVAPFLVPLKKWVVSQKKIDARRAPSGTHSYSHHPIDEVTNEEDAWTQTDTGAEPLKKTPAIETLEGATQELQRLLKVQPPTQGLQPTSSQPDKGSALLSILQAGAGNAETASYQLGNQYPQPPSGLPLREPSQPLPPHHHQHHQQQQQQYQQHQQQMAMHASQQVPPAFHPQQGHQVPPWPMPGNQHVNPQYPVPPQQQYGSNQATLVHPQPLPPQVQRAVFNRSVFQDGTNPSNLSGAAGYSNAQPGQHPVPTGMPSYTGNQPMPTQLPVSASSGPSQLNGQSMALLNAFKSGPAVGHAHHAVSQTQNPGTGIAQQGQPHMYAGIQQAGVHQAPAPMKVAERPQPSPKELAGSKVVAPGDGHRSALLGMFRKAEPQTNTGHYQHDQVSPFTSQPGTVPGDFLGPSEAAIQRGLVSSQGSSDVSHHQLSMEALSLQHRAGQAGTPSSQSRPDYAPQYASQQPTIQMGQSQGQPIRILQHGPSDQLLGMGGQAVPSPQQLPAHTDQSVAGSFASPALSSSFLSTSAQGRRPESGADQKRQLLSLFGKQQAQASGVEGLKGMEVLSEMPRSRVASLASGAGEVVAIGGLGATSSAAPSRRGSQTPISPADRSFLLGYLESVTNNATR